MNANPSPTAQQTATALRACASGSYPLEAAVELLARAFDGRFARPGRLWIGLSAGASLHARLQADVLADEAVHGPYSGGERRLLAVAASLAGGPSVALDEVIPGLDRYLLDLVLAAVAHTGGSHEHPVMAPHPNLGGALFPTRDLAGPLHPWPTDAPDHEPDHDRDHGAGVASAQDGGPVR
jgi:hypothetical protein